jgi:hypothetical protein
MVRNHCPHGVTHLSACMRVDVEPAEDVALELMPFSHPKYHLQPALISVSDCTAGSPVQVNHEQGQTGLPASRKRWQKACSLKGRCLSEQIQTASKSEAVLISMADCTAGGGSRNDCHHRDEPGFYLQREREPELLSRGQSLQRRRRLRFYEFFSLGIEHLVHPSEITISFCCRLHSWRRGSGRLPTWTSPSPSC